MASNKLYGNKVMLVYRRTFVSQLFHQKHVNCDESEIQGHFKDFQGHISGYSRTKCLNITATYVNSQQSFTSRPSLCACISARASAHVLTLYRNENFHINPTSTLKEISVKQTTV